MNDGDSGDRDADLQRILAGLTPRELKVLREHFGVTLDGSPLEEVARQFEITRRRIREIEEKFTDRPPEDDPKDAA